jgi:hypothetical protein
MNLDDAQRKKVAEWIAQGQKLSEIQNRLMSELGVRMTYMEVRLLVDDLKLTPKDIEPLKPAPQGSVASALTAPAARPPAGGAVKPDEAPRGAGSVSVTVDHLARPGAIVSGKVTFSDGVQAEWQLDQSNRLGVIPKQPGYKPTAADLQKFQIALESELAKMGFA